METKKQNRFTKLIKKHKVVSCAVLVVCLVGVVGVGTAFGIHQAKIDNTKRALEMAKDGYIDADELAQLGEEIATGEEIVTEDGSVVVVTRNEKGEYVTTTIRDSQGNNTGAVVPEDHGGSQGGGDPTPVIGHTHNFIPHYATRQVEQTNYVHHDAVTQQVCIRQGGAYCNTCDAYINGASAREEHTHATGHGGFHTESPQYETQVVQPAWDEPVTTYVTEQYIDYYYCSECGERQ